MDNSNAANDGADKTAAKPSRFARWLGKLKHVKTGLVAVAGVGAVLSGLVGWYTTYRTVAGPAAPVASAAPVAPLSILVLPFANQTGDAQKAYIADALTSSISADLNRIRDAFVVPTATAFTFKDRALSVQQIGQAAGVRFVLQGNVLASGEKLRISAQLSDAQNGTQLWNETFEGELGKLFELQDLVTARIGNSIGPEMVIVAARDSAKRANSSKVADLMLRARALRAKRQSLADYIQMEKLYREVLVQDPGNAVAMADLASTLALHGFNYLQTGDPLQDSLVAEAQELALRAKALDPNLPGIYIALSIHAGLHNDLDGSRRMLEERLARDPKNPSAYINLASVRIFAGEPQQALDLLKQALALYPRGSTALFTNMADDSLMLGDNDAVIGWAQKALDIDAGFFASHAQLAMAYANKGDTAKAQQHAAEYKRLTLAAGVKTGIDAQVLPAGLSQAYNQYYQTRYVPQWKTAGLP